MKDNLTRHKVLENKDELLDNRVVTVTAGHKGSVQQFLKENFDRSIINVHIKENR